MKRKVYLIGEMADKFGESMQVSANSFPEILKCVDVNRPGFMEYLTDCHERGVAFDFSVDDEYLGSQEEFFLPMGKGDVYITPVPAGAKSGGQKILAAIAIAALFFIAPASGPFALISEGALTILGTATLALSLNLAIAGIQQLMLPDPGTDEDSPQSYLFNGSEQNVIEGDPVPVLYGELKVPGTLISFEVVNREFSKNNARIDTSGNLILES